MYIILEIVGHREDADHLLNVEIAVLVAASVKGNSLRVKNSTGQCNQPFVCLKKFVSKGRENGSIDYDGEEGAIGADTKRIIEKKRGVKQLLGKRVRIKTWEAAEWKYGSIIAAALYDESKTFQCPIY